MAETQKEEPSLHICARLFITKPKVILQDTALFLVTPRGCEWIRPTLTHIQYDGFLGQHESTPPPNGLSISSAVFAQSNPCDKHTDTHRQTKLRATSVTTSRIYAMYAMRPKTVRVMFSLFFSSFLKYFDVFYLLPRNAVLS